MSTFYTVSDGKMMLILEAAEEGGYIVTSPIDPQLITQAETLEEAFSMAYDARELLIQGRAELARKLMGSPSFPTVPIPELSSNPEGEAEAVTSSSS